MLRPITCGLLAAAALCPSARAQTAEPPEYLGILAGAGSAQEPRDVKLYGTDLGWTFSHAGQLFILFGDSWRTDYSLCDVQTHGIDSNDDSQGTLPLRYPGGVPSLSVATQPSSAREFEEMVLTRDGRSLDMSTNRTPLGGFSDGKRAVVVLQSGSFLECTDASPSCPEPFTCAAELGQCQPALLNLSQPCDTRSNAGCYAGQVCVTQGRGYCVDPESAQPQLQNRAALELDLTEPDASAPTHYTSKYTWSSNKFLNPAVRTVQQLDKDGANHDYNQGTNVLLAWGRPGFYASQGLSIPLYLLIHELPLNEDASGKFEFRPSYFAGLDSDGKPTWSASEADAVPLSLDGQPGGDTAETVAATNQMSISWLADPIDKWVMLYGGGGTAEGDAGPPGYIAMRFADHPWGPWTPPQIHLAEGAPDQPNTPLGPGGVLYHPDCSDNLGDKCARTDPRRPLHTLNPFCLPPLVETDRGIFYSPNIIDEYTAQNASGGLDIYWNLSAWNPYRVHFYRTSIYAQSR